MVRLVVGMVNDMLVLLLWEMFWMIMLMWTFCLVSFVNTCDVILGLLGMFVSVIFILVVLCVILEMIGFFIVLVFMIRVFGCL